MGQAHIDHLFHIIAGGLDSRYRNGKKRFPELDRSRGVFRTAVRVHQACTDRFLAKFLSEKQRYITTVKKGLAPSLSLVFLAFGLIMLQPDLGTGTVMVGTCFVMLFIAGARIFHFAILGLAGLAGFVGLILSAPYRMARITSFLDPWQDPLNSGFQIIQSLYAIGPGGLFGLGLGESRQKFFYLPEPQTDFIFAILSEELGFIGEVLSYCCLPFCCGAG